MRQLLGRIVDTALDGLIQAAAVAFFGVVITTAWLYWKHLQGPWRERAIGAVAAFCMVTIVTAALVIARRLSRNTRTPAKVDLRSVQKGLLDFRVEAEVAVSEVLKVLTRMTALQHQVGASTRKRTRQIEKVKSRGGNAKALLRIASKAAGDLDNVSERMDLERKRLDVLLNDFTAGLIGLLQSDLPANNNPEELRNLRDNLLGVLKGTELARKSQQGYCDSIPSIRGLSQILNRSADRHEEVVRLIAQTLITTASELQKIIRLITVRLESTTPSDPDVI